MRVGVVVLVVMSFCLGRLESTAADSDLSVPPIKVMSFNIRYGTAEDGPNHWSLRKSFLIDTIKSNQPDLLGTQETLGFQKAEIAKALPEYDSAGVGRNDGADDGEMTALFYRRDRFERLETGHFWLSTTPEVPGSKSWDSSLPRMVTWVRLRDRLDKEPNAKAIVFLNTHFDHKGIIARNESASLIRNKVKEFAQAASIVLTGDFNAAEASEPYLRLFSSDKEQTSALVDSLRQFRPERLKDEGTFSNFQANVITGPRIDWIGVSRDWQILDASIDRTARDGATPSDHFPVLTTIRR